MIRVCGELLILGKSVIRHTQGNPRPDAFGLRADYDGPQPARNHHGIHDGVVADPRRARLLVSLSTLCLAISRDKSDR
jgi:hypothetical protein